MLKFLTTDKKIYIIYKPLKLSGLIFGYVPKWLKGPHSKFYGDLVVSSAGNP